MALGMPPHSAKETKWLSGNRREMGKDVVDIGLAIELIIGALEQSVNKLSI